MNGSIMPMICPNCNKGCVEDFCDKCGSTTARNSNYDGDEIARRYQNLVKSSIDLENELVDMEDKLIKSRQRELALTNEIKDLEDVRCELDSRCGGLTRKLWRAEESLREFEDSRDLLNAFKTIVDYLGIEREY